MYSQADLDAAVSAGVLTPEAVAGFRAFVERQRSSSVADEEQFRLLSGFNDIFVSIAILLMLIALGWIGGQIISGAGALLVAAASWGLGEYFTRRRRMALPSILLLLAFVLAVFMGALALLAGSLTLAGLVRSSTPLAALPVAVAAAGAYLHWRRFMVPITPAVGGLAAVLTLVVLALAAFPALKALSPLIFLLGGLTLFAFAMRWDMSDRERTTRRSDVAFWMHLAAAPMLVHPAFALLGLAGKGTLLALSAAPVDADLGAAGLAVAVYLGLAVVALMIDRRALLVSALFYVLYAISVLFRAAGSLTFSLALTALVIGSGLLLLSAFWHPARAVLLRRLPEGLRSRLPAG